MVSRYRASLVLYPDTDEALTRAVEMLGRTATGFALEGLEAMVMVGPDDEDDD